MIEKNLFYRILLLLIFLLFLFVKVNKNNSDNNETLIDNNNNINDNNKDEDNNNDIGNDNVDIDNNFNDININNNYIHNNYIYNNFVYNKKVNGYYSYYNKAYKYKNKMNIVPVSFSADNNYIYPLIVLLTSILFNSSPSTFYSFHILVPNDFLEINKKKVFGLTKKYPKCEVTIHNLGDKYLYWSVYGNYTQTVYYRLSLSDIIKDLDKIIYLDCDTMVHKDLLELYNIKMGDKYYMGFPGHEIGYIEINGTRNFINSGVMLVNLKLLREVKAPIKYEEYYNIYGTQKVDEYLINNIFYDKIKFLPLKFGIPDFEEGHHIIGSPSIFYNSLNNSLNQTEEEMINSSNNRIVTHGAYKEQKWWSREYETLSDIGKKWIFYASKSNVFNDICKQFPQYRLICKKLMTERNIHKLY